MFEYCDIVAVANWSSKDWLVTFHVKTCTNGFPLHSLDEWLSNGLRRIFTLRMFLLWSNLASSYIQHIKRGRQNILRIENQWRKIEIFFISPKHPFRQNIPFCGGTLGWCGEFANCAFHISCISPNLGEFFLAKSPVNYLAKPSTQVASELCFGSLNS